MSATLSSWACVSLFLMLLHSLWQATVLAMLGYAISWSACRKSANARYWVNLSALILMAIVMAGTFVLLIPSDPLLARSASLTERLRPLGQMASDIAVPVAKHAPPAGHQAPEPQPVPSTDVFRSAMWSRVAPYTAMAYLIGVTTMLVRLLAAVWGGRRLQASARQFAEGEIITMVRRQAAVLRLRCIPAVLYCERVAVPVVIGIFRPMILLPLAVTTGLTADEVQAILTHELAHIRRLDPLFNIAQRVLEAILFFNPAAWYVSRQVTVERENCCDDLVVGSGTGRVVYAQSLARIAELYVRSRPNTVAALAAGGERPSRLRDRIERLLAGDQPRLRVIPRGFVGLAFLLVAGIAAGTAVLASGENPPARTLARGDQKSSEGAKLDVEETAAALVKKASAYREAIKSLHLRAVVRQLDAIESDQSKLEMEVWHDNVNDIHRCDRRFTLPDGTRQPRNIVGWQCVHKGLYLSYDDPAADRVPLVTSGKTKSGFYDVPNMRLLGMLPTGWKELAAGPEPRTGFESMTADRWLQELSAGVVEKLPSYVLDLLGLAEADANHLRSVAFTRSIKLGSGAGRDSQPADRDLQPATLSGRAVFDTRKGYSIVFTERRFATVVDSTVFHLKRWGDFWYPERVVTEQKQNAGSALRQQLTVSQLVLNKREKFDTLKAMGIKPGSLVRGAPGVDDFFQWDGAKIVPAQVVPARKRQNARSIKPNPRVKTEKNAAVIDGHLEVPQRNVVKGNKGGADGPSKSVSKNANLATISGRIVLKDGSPATAKGWLYSEGTDSSRKSYVKGEGLFTDAFSIKVPAGTLWLKYYPDGFAPAWAGPLETESGKVVGDVKIVLRAGFSSTVRVVDPAGVPIGGATLAALPVIGGSSNGPRFDKRTNHQGEYLFEHVAAIPYVFLVEAPGHESLNTSPLALKAGETLMLSLAPSQQTTGVVLNADGTPAKGAKIRLQYEAMSDKTNSATFGHGKVIATTNDAGRFTLDQLTATSRYLFIVESAEKSRMVVSTLRAGQKDVRLQLPKRQDLRVRIVGDVNQLPKRSGKPVVTIRQEISMGEINLDHTALIGGDAYVAPSGKGGLVEYPGLVPGTVQVTAGTQEQTVAVAEAGVTEVVFQFREVGQVRAQAPDKTVSAAEIQKPETDPAHKQPEEKLRGAAMDIQATQTRTLQQLPSWLKPLYTHGLLANIDDSGSVTMLTAGEVMTDELFAKLATLPKLRELDIEVTKTISPAGLAHLSNLPALEKLNLYEVNREGAGLGDDALRIISRLKSLRDLSISECGTTDAGVRHLEAMPQLTHLRLGDGRLTDAALASIAKLKRLKQLELSSYGGSVAYGRMSFTPQGLRQLTGLQELEVLSLAGHAPTAEFFAFPKLTSLSVGGVNDVAVTRIAQCRNLQFLELMYADVTDDGLKQIATLPKLRRLSLHSTVITDAGVAHLRALPRLEHVELRATKVSDESLKHLSEIKTLTRLDLNGSGLPGVNLGKNFTIDGLQQLKHLPKLRTLWLTNLELNGGYGVLKELTQLRELTLSMTDINDMEADALEDALPNTTIHVSTGGGGWVPKKMRAKAVKLQKTVDMKNILPPKGP